MKRLLLGVSLAMLLVMVIGCGGPERKDIPGLTMDLIRDMIAAYFLGDYDGAREKADEIVALAPDRSEPYAVYGLIYMAQDSLDQARAYFDLAIGKPEGVNDHAYIGRAMLNRQLGNCNAVIQDIETVLTATPDYKLPSDEMEIDPPPPFTLTADHLKLLMAQCYYILGQFQKAQDTAGIQNLNSNNSATWVVGGIAYKSYEAALGVALELLEGSIVRGGIS